MADSQDTAVTSDVAVPTVETDLPSKAASPAKEMIGDTQTTELRLSLYKSAVDDLRQTIFCKVCLKPMYEPYTVGCGHVFCYSCLKQWFESNRSNKTCPDCRAAVFIKPAPAYMIREMVQLLTSRPELLPDDEDAETHSQARREETLQVEMDRSTGGLFPKCFGFASRIANRTGLHDAGDNVIRCPDCLWEVEDGYCSRCDIEINPEPLSDTSDLDDEMPLRNSNAARILGFDVADTRRWARERRLSPRATDHTLDTDDTDYPFDSEDDPEDDHDTDLDDFIEDDGPHEDELSNVSDGGRSVDILPDGRSVSPSDFPYHDSDSEVSAAYIHFHDSHRTASQEPIHNLARNRRHRPAIVVDSSDEDSDDSSDIPRASETANPDLGDQTHFASSSSESTDEESDHTAAPDTLPISRPARKRRRVVDDDSEDESVGEAEDRSLLSQSSTGSSHPGFQSDSIVADAERRSSRSHHPDNRIQPICLDDNVDGTTMPSSSDGPRNNRRTRHLQRMPPPVSLSRFNRTGRPRRGQAAEP